jgi:tRNA G18 (ribose-2'-O)-methylase SpoU
MWDEFSIARPIGATLIGVEMDGEPLNDFMHPPQAVYLLGAEDHGLPDEIRDKCNRIVSLNSVRVPSYNVAVAGSIVLYHRVFLS